MKPITVRNRARGLAIGNPERFKDSPVYDEVRDLPHTKGPGLILDEDGDLRWLGDSGDKYKLLLDELVKEAGLSHEEAVALWSYLDYKRSQVWYVKGQKRRPESHEDEKATKAAVSFEHNNLTVSLKNGYTLEHFMAIHYGINWFTYRVWPRYAEWKNRAVVREASEAILPEFNPGDPPEGAGDLILWRIKLEMMSHCPTLVDPKLAVKVTGARFKKNWAKANLGAEEDINAAHEMLSAAQKLVSKR
jgi:hypothetical protein